MTAGRKFAQVCATERRQGARLSQPASQGPKAGLAWRASGSGHTRQRAYATAACGQLTAQLAFPCGQSQSYLAAAVGVE